MGSLNTKKSADDFLDQADAYAIMGIDLDKCTMPETSPSHHYEHGKLPEKTSSVGHFIFTRLQPALENLVDAVVNEQTASFYDARMLSAKARVTKELLALATVSGEYDDKASIDGLAEKVHKPSLQALINAGSEIVDDVTQKLTEKVRLATLAAEQQQAKKFK